jgi:hypothetical protein
VTLGLSGARKRGIDPYKGINPEAIRANGILYGRSASFNPMNKGSPVNVTTLGEIPHVRGL